MHRKVLKDTLKLLEDNGHGYQSFTMKHSKELVCGKPLYTDITIRMILMDDNGQPQKGKK